MNPPKLTAAQLQTLKDIRDGLRRYISDMDIRVRRALEARELLKWERSGPYFGRIRRDETTCAARKAGLLP